MCKAATLSRFSGNGYAARLERRGFDLIATGGGYSFPATYVLAKPDHDAVIKVGAFPAGDPWPLYAAWSLEQPGPFKPTIRSLRWHGSGFGRCFVASMDRLYTPDWGAGEAATLLHVLWYWYEAMRARGLDYREWNDEWINPRWVEELAHKLVLVDLTDAAEFILGLVQTFPGLALDPQPPNWMVTGDGKLVLIDPFTRTPWDHPETASRLVRGRADGS